MRNKQVEFNPYTYTLSKLSRFGYKISVFKYTTGRYSEQPPEQPANTSWQQLHGKMDVKIFLMFIVAENTGSVNIIISVVGLHIINDYNDCNMHCIVSNRLIGKTRLSLIGWDFFEFSSKTAEQSSTKLDRKQISQHPLPSSCLLGLSEKQDGCPGLWLAEAFSTSPLKLLHEIWRNLTGSKIPMSSTKFVFCFVLFFADRKNKMAAMASDLLRHFSLLLWNSWMEFNESWQEARFQRFWLLLWSCWLEFNDTWQEDRSQRPFPRFFFRADQKTKLANLSIDVAHWASCLSKKRYHLGIK